MSALKCIGKVHTNTKSNTDKKKSSKNFLFNYIQEEYSESFQISNLLLNQVKLRSKA